ncbi:MAG: hypothetical protein WBD40_10825 [Tepidisphaeraceae bacterium]
MSLLNTAQVNALNAISPSAVAAGVSLGTLLNTILTDLTSGPFAVEADAWDIDAIAQGGGNFAQDADTTTGLTFGHRGGRLFNGSTIVTVGAGTVALSASTTNYVECSRAGVVSKNTSGFTAGSVPLFTITTGASAIDANGITSSKSPLFAIPNGGFPGSQLTAAGATKELIIPLGTVAATTSFSIVAPNHAATLSLAPLTVKTAITASDTNYWTASMVNKGASGAGSTAMLLATDANTTKATAPGSGISAYVARQLALHGTGANLITAANDVLEFTLTKTAAAADLVQAALRLDFGFSI